jgi:tetratricopeptide (TPR) repeat protein
MYVTAFLISAVLATAAVQEHEVTSLLGKQFDSMEDEKGVIDEAKAKLAADPDNVDLLIELGQAYASVWRYHDAIETYSKGLEKDPDHAMLYRHRGHRYISIRDFDKAVKDLETAAKLNDKSFDIWYHLGLAYYLKGEFAKAEKAYQSCRATCESDDELVAVGHWLYMSLRRQGDEAQAAELLKSFHPDMTIEENQSYFDLLMFYKGIKKEEEVLDMETAEPLDFATSGYGLANWHLYNGDEQKANTIIDKILEGPYWPAFGFIAAEVEASRR